MSNIHSFYFEYLECIVRIPVYSWSKALVTGKLEELHLAYMSFHVYSIEVYKSVNSCTYIGRGSSSLLTETRGLVGEGAGTYY